MGYQANLATLSLDVYKPNKRKAQDILNAIHEGSSQDVEKDLAKLYRYFMPPAPKKPKTEWDWVAQACAKYDARVYLQYVHVTETTIEATNGHVHRMIPNDRGVESGFWCPCSGDKVELNTPYPDTGKIVPEEAPMRCERVSGFDWEVIESGSYKAYRIDAVDGTKIGAQVAYVDSALQGMNEGAVIQRAASPNGPAQDAAIRISDGRKVATIMPLRI